MKCSQAGASRAEGRVPRSSDPCNEVGGGEHGGSGGHQARSLRGRGPRGPARHAHEERGVLAGHPGVHRHDLARG